MTRSPAVDPYGAGMLRRFGLLYHLTGLGWLMRRVRLDLGAVDRIRTSSQKGPVVYVLGRLSRLDHLALNAALHERRLPLSVWSATGTMTPWQPLGLAIREAWERLWGRWQDGAPPDPVGSGWLQDAVAAGHPVTVVLEERADDVLAAVFAAAPRGVVQLLPVAVIWDRAPRDDGWVRQMVRGAEPPPGFVRELFRALVGRRGGAVAVGEAVHVGDVMSRFPRNPPRAARSILHRMLHREEAVVRGPRLMPWQAMRHRVLDNPPMEAFARQEAARRGQPVGVVRQAMEREYASVAARFRWIHVVFLARLLHPLWTRVFAGIDIRPEDLEAIRKAMRQGTVVIVPCHKSHLDYLLLSWVFYENDLMLPHVVAGMNLAIWPISTVLRGAGAFFVRRRYGDDPVHPTVFGRYLRELVWLGYPVEFFIEGGRTRTGRLLRPKLGVLATVLEAAERRPHADQADVVVLPVALAYEEIAEEGSYAAELAGAEKRPETVGQVLQARSVLERRFGRVMLRVGRPIPLGPVVDAGPGRASWSDRPEVERREHTRRLGEEIVAEIGAAMVVTAGSLVAAALLAHHRRGLAHAELVARCARYRRWLNREGMTESEPLVRFEAALQLALERMVRAGHVEALGSPGERVWATVPERRIRLDFYKNQILHGFVRGALVAAAIRGRGDQGWDADLLADVTWLGTLLSRELLLDPRWSWTDVVDGGLEALAAHGALVHVQGRYEVSDGARMAEIWALLGDLLEGAGVALADVGRLGELGGDANRWAAAVVASARDAGARAWRRPEALSSVALAGMVDGWRRLGVLPAAGRAADPELVAAALARLQPMT